MVSIDMSRFPAGYRILRFVRGRSSLPLAKEQEGIEMERLPVLISIPHGGDQVPRDLRRMVRLSDSDLFYEGDSLTRTLFGFHDRVEAVVETTVSRVVIDLDRYPDDRPPESPDGVIKSITAMGAPVFRNDKLPGERLIEKLMHRYYYPYHEKLDRLSEKPGVRIALDCHSMLPHSPVFYKSRIGKRPLICLNNCGMSRAEEPEGGVVLTCPISVMQQLAECFAEAFELPEDAVLINGPVIGGYLIRSHYTGRIPWVRVSINKDLYLQTNKRKKGSGLYSPARVDRVKTAIWTALKLFFLNFNGYSV